MKHITHHLAAALSLAAICPALPAAEENKNTTGEKTELRVISRPEHDRRIFVRKDETRGKRETEKVTFLGVEAFPVSAVLSAQLGLPPGTGLVVGHVAPSSAAAGVLKQHDILLKLDDQVLIETRQLSVLVRGHKEGDEVTLTYLRTGQKATATVKLGTHEVPKVSALDGPHARAFAFGGTPGGNWFNLSTPDPEGDREEVDRVLSLIRRAPVAPGAARGGPPPPARGPADRPGRPGFRAIAVHPDNSNLVFSDDHGSLELTIKDGIKSLVAKGPDGAQIFTGAVTTPEERHALPADVRARLEKLEGMHDVTFKTGGEFEGAERKVVRPTGRSISLPVAPPATPRRSPGSI